LPRHVSLKLSASHVAWLQAGDVRGAQIEPMCKVALRTEVWLRATNRPKNTVQTRKPNLMPS
jgi:hypothetical protein